MDIAAVQEEIKRVKKEKDIYILAHSYMAPEVTEIADFTGDSYALAKEGAKVKNKTLLVCGVRFMAETMKILAPEKRVVLANPAATCPMAEQFTPGDIEKLKEEKPAAAVVCYINTTAALKTVCDVCVTSSSAMKIVEKMPEKDIIFVPDINLGTFIKEKCPEKNITLVRGGCPVHSLLTAEDAKRAKEENPKALLLVHPECPPEVAKMADYVGSTAGIMEYAKGSKEKEFIIGTENSIVQHLQYGCPEKRFYPLSKNMLCRDMRLTTLPQVLQACEGSFGEEVELPGEVMVKAKRCIDKMMEYGG